MGPTGGVGQLKLATVDVLARQGRHEAAASQVLKQVAIAAGAAMSPCLEADQWQGLPLAAPACLSVQAGCSTQAGYWRRHGMKWRLGDRE